MDFLEKCREFGKERLAIVEKIKATEDWKQMWKNPANPYIFKAGPCWTFTAEYQVDDFEAEVGFFVDVIGMESNALDHNYSMFMHPEGGFYFSVVPTPKGGKPTPTDTFRLEFMFEDIVATCKTLEVRGVVFERQPAPYTEGNSLYQGAFRTPNGVLVRVWGVVE